MMRHGTARWIGAITASLICAAVAQAQFAYSGTAEAGNGIVSTSGTAIVKRKPDVLRMQVELSAKGKTLKEALTKLKTQRDAALERLTKLDAVKESLKAGDPKISAVANDRQRQMENMVRQRMRQSGKKSKKAVEHPPISLATTITAEWKLSGADAEARLLESHALEEKIRAANLAGNKDSETKSLEEEEADEEMAQMMQGYDDGSTPKPGEPMFIYVARISKEDQNQAFASAYADAKSQAERLTRAAGANLGPLRGLSSSASPLGMQNYFGRNNPYMQQYYQQMYEQGAITGEEGSGPQGEAVGTQSHEVSLAIRVNAQFGLREPAAEKAGK